jgi:pyruvate ferredoxin oxidoreductase gamma subunit
MEVVDIFHGLKKGGIVLLNSAHPREFAGFRTYTADLTGIALKEKLVVAGNPVLDTTVLGALAKIGIITLVTARKAITEMFSDELDVKAADDAFRETVV